MSIFDPMSNTYLFTKSHLRFIGSWYYEYLHYNIEHEYCAYLCFSTRSDRYHDCFHDTPVLPNVIYHITVVTDATLLWHYVDDDQYLDGSLWMTQTRIGSRDMFRAIEGDPVTTGVEWTGVPFMS